MRTGVALLAVLWCAPVAAAPDPATAVDVTAARTVIAEGATCVPRALRPGLGRDHTEVGRLELQLGAVDGTPLLCAHLKHLSPWQEDELGTLPLGIVGCWEVDATHRRLVPTAPRLLPGLPVHTALVGGCTHGLCLPTGTKLPDDAEPMVAINDTGDLAAILVLSDLRQRVDGFLFDRGKATFVRRFQIDAGDMINRLVLVGDRVAVQHCKAAPHCSFEVFATTGTDAEPVGLALKGGRWINGYHGMLTVLAPGALGFGGVEWAELGRYDVATGAVTALRKRKRSACADGAMERDRYGACVAREVQPRTDAFVIAIGRGYLARLSAPRTGDLVTLGPTLAERARFNAFCAK